MPKVLPEYKQEAKKRIIEGAMKTFFKMGYQKTKMTDIGKTLGVSKGAIYQYFNSKEQLFFEVFDLVITKRRSKIIEFLKEEGLDGIKLEQYFNLNLLSPNVSLNFTADLISESLNNEKLNKKLSNYYSQALNKTEFLFNEYKKKGLIKNSVDSRGAALELFGMLEGLKSILYYGVSISEVRQVWTRYANNLLNEIKKKKNHI